MGKTAAEMRHRAKERMEFLIDRDGLVCRIPECHRPEVFTKKDFPTVDHIIPRAKGGTDDYENLQIGHVSCNQRKADRLVLPDGTLEPVVRNTKPVKIQKRDPCEECYEGRLLLFGEECSVCGSGPMPAKFPKYRQKVPKECDHRIYHCFACVIGIYEREPAATDALLEKTQ